ncbi:hypothetical protein BpHYR1_018170 [Brachionus plicatilis]|uniref:Uncharacterized protein n=1 Tax=Brachionus plicatilis TaxID=10195 RepID=A0A3M7SHC2_BRAPC|nr:hypothetical protein BpHYR1_018170 [Brachionus plicatilis]
MESVANRFFEILSKMKKLNKDLSRKPNLKNFHKKTFFEALSVLIFLNSDNRIIKSAFKIQLMLIMAIFPVEKEATFFTLIEYNSNLVFKNILAELSITFLKNTISNTSCVGKNAKAKICLEKQKLKK